MRAKDRDGELSSLLPATYATIFFGTPHRGLVVDNMLSTVGDNQGRIDLLKSIQVNGGI